MCNVYDVEQTLKAQQFGCFQWETKCEPEKDTNTGIMIQREKESLGNPRHRKKCGFSRHGEDFVMGDNVKCFSKDDSLLLGKIIKLWEDDHGRMLAKLEWFMSPEEIADFNFVSMQFRANEVIVTRQTDDVLLLCIDRKCAIVRPELASPEEAYPHGNEFVCKLWYNRRSNKLFPFQLTGAASAVTSKPTATDTRPALPDPHHEAFTPLRVVPSAMAMSPVEPNTGAETSGMQMRTSSSTSEPELAQMLEDLSSQLPETQIHTIRGRTWDFVIFSPMQKGAGGEAVVDIGIVPLQKLEPPSSVAMAFASDASSPHVATQQSLPARSADPSPSPVASPADAGIGCGERFRFGLILDVLASHPLAEEKLRHDMELSKTQLLAVGTASESIDCLLRGLSARLKNAQHAQVLLKVFDMLVHLYLYPPRRSKASSSSALLESNRKCWDAMLKSPDAGESRIESASELGDSSNELADSESLEYQAKDETLSHEFEVDAQSTGPAAGSLSRSKSQKQLALHEALMTESPPTCPTKPDGYLDDLLEFRSSLQLERSPAAS
eukprot:g48879.t1